MRTVERIVFITNFRTDFGGGEGRVAYEMAHHFASRYQAALLCPGDRTELARQESGLLLFSLSSKGEGNLCVPLLTRSNLRKIFDFLDEFEPDVIHGHDPTLIGVIGQLWAKMHAVPFVFTSHVLPWKILDFGANEAIWIPARSLTESVAREFFFHFYNNCDAVIAMNQAAAAGIRQGGYNRRVFVIPNGRHLSRYMSCRLADTSSAEKVLSFVGYISRRKNQGFLLEALTHLPSAYRLQLIGEALNPAIERQLRRFARQNGLEGRVVFTGKVSHDQVPAYLERSHAFVSASTMEVQSLSVIEALASGTPVVGLSNETIDELVDEGVGARLPRETSPEEFARQVARICQLRQPEYERLCRQARRRVKHLDWENVARLTGQAYELLASERPALGSLDGIRLARIIAQIPSAPVRRFLVDRAVAWSARLQKVQRVPRRTWLYAGLNVLSSLVISPFLKPPGASFRWVRRVSAGLPPLPAGRLRPWLAPRTRRP